jgi:glyoxylase-like metal-dependent hydrolase (beta-lactamase superfamily II)
VSLRIDSFFDETTSTASYVVTDTDAKACCIIDSVLDFDAASGRVTHHAADHIIAHIRAHDLKVGLILETHAHADHLSAAAYLKSHLGGAIGIGRHITDVQAIFARIYNLKDLKPDGHQFDRLFGEGDSFAVGNLTGSVMHTPGHTPACVAYRIGDAAFVGDTMFMPDYGTARADFPGGDAATLYRSIRRILALPPETRLFLCHDYKASSRDAFVWETTVAAQRRENIHVHDGVGEKSFVTMRQARDKTLAMPTLLLPSIQVNIRAGRLPDPEDNGIAYLKLPLNAL